MLEFCQTGAHCFGSSVRFSPTESFGPLALCPTSAGGLFAAPLGRRQTFDDLKEPRGSQDQVGKTPVSKFLGGNPLSQAGRLVTVLGSMRRKTLFFAQADRRRALRRTPPRS